MASSTSPVAEVLARRASGAAGAATVGEGEAEGVAEGVAEGEAEGVAESEGGEPEEEAEGEPEAEAEGVPDGEPDAEGELEVLPPPPLVPEQLGVLLPVALELGEGELEMEEEGRAGTASASTSSRDAAAAGKSCSQLLPEKGAGSAPPAAAREARPAGEPAEASRALALRVPLLALRVLAEEEKEEEEEGAPALHREKLRSEPGSRSRAAVRARGMTSRAAACTMGG